eukprot:scaffold15171_cov51-Phaeocystis_antarctica.AAC.1
MGVIGGSGVSAGLGTRDDGCGVTWLDAASKASSAAAADARAISSYTLCERVSPSPFDELPKKLAKLPSMGAATCCTASVS